MKVFNIHDARTNFSKLLENVIKGKEAVIAKAGKPVVRILPYVAEDIFPRVPAIGRGKVIIMPDFDAPLSEFDL